MIVRINKKLRRTSYLYDNVNTLHNCFELNINGFPFIFFHETKCEYIDRERNVKCANILYKTASSHYKQIYYCTITIDGTVEFNSVYINLIAIQ